jgi:diaminopimelate decarboxylase
MYSDICKKYGTPLYVYDLDGLRRRARFFREQMPKQSAAFFAIKANNNPAVLKVLLEEGFGVDAVSQGEMECARQVGFQFQQIVFSGVAKTRSEIEYAIKNNIRQINIESLPELERVIEVARSLELSQPAAVALRINPDVCVNTHPHIQTGLRDNKFGLDFSEVPEFTRLIKKNNDCVELRGLTLHIGSQIRDVDSFGVAIQKSLDLYRNLQTQGFELTTFDVGGGLGISYESTDLTQDEELIRKYMSMIKTQLAGQVKEVFFEPGRILVARFGQLIVEVQYVKRTPYKNFIIVDGGMHELMRPALYQAFHRIDLLYPERSSVQREVFDVVGPICESTDTLGRDRYLSSHIQSGDLLVVHDVGAYGAVMANRYNLRPQAHQVSIRNGQIIQESL